MKQLMITAIFITLLSPLNAVSFTPDHLTPVLGQTDIHQLRDGIYFFPANRTTDSRTIFLPLKRWDIIFTGDHVNLDGSKDDSENIDHLIPGPFNHAMVYLGKDDNGLAYAVEVSADTIAEGGTIRLICLGYDFGLIRHPDAAHVIDKRIITHRWAKRFINPEYEKLKKNEPVLLEQIQQDLIDQLPYQLLFSHSGSIFDQHIHLIDDGAVDGANCSDYWTALFETHAGICFTGVRMDTETIQTYFTTDVQGMLAYIPKELNPFPFKVYFKQLPALGFKVIADDPHIFSCDGTQETGIVLPSLLMESPLLKEIPPLTLPFSPIFTK